MTLHSKHQRWDKAGMRSAGVGGEGSKGSGAGNESKKQGRTVVGYCHFTLTSNMEMA